MSIGRKSGGILLEDDPKVSAAHAILESDNKDQLVVRDLNSANGLFLGDKKVKKISLVPGVTFRVGNTLLRVIKEEELPISVPTKAAAPLADIDLPPLEPLSVLSAQLKPPPLPKQAVTWHETLSHLLSTYSLKPKPSLLKTTPFAKPITLEFVEGWQSEQKFTLGYGPRYAGYLNLDIRLLDPQAPEEAFEIFCERDKVYIRDLSHGKVFLNKNVFDLEEIRDGDSLSFGQTKIKFGFL